MRGTIVDMVGPYNFHVEVTLTGQLTKWKRHADQLRKCYDSSNVTPDSTPDTVELIVYETSLHLSSQLLQLWSLAEILPEFEDH